MINIKLENTKEILILYSSNFRNFSPRGSQQYTVHLQTISLVQMGDRLKGEKNNIKCVSNMLSHQDSFSDPCHRFYMSLELDQCSSLWY